MLMAKDMLFNNYWSFIASGSSSQAQNTFTTLERLANNNIDTMVGSTGELFKAELVIPNANGDGFSHNPDGFKYTLNNGAMTMTLNSNIDRKRGEFSDNLTTFASPDRNVWFFYFIKVKKCGRNRESWNANPSGRLCLKARSHAEHSE